ncbi:hypothetical protein H1C71_007965, partial [Ictidomys tridecemlineatus]
ILCPSPWVTGDTSEGVLVQWVCFLELGKDPVSQGAAVRPAQCCTPPLYHSGRLSLPRVSTSLPRLLAPQRAQDTVFTSVLLGSWLGPELDARDSQEKGMQTYFREFGLMKATCCCWNPH